MTVASKLTRQRKDLGFASLESANGLGPGGLDSVGIPENERDWYT